MSPAGSEPSPRQARWTLNRSIGVTIFGAFLTLTACRPAGSQADVRSEILRVDAQWLEAVQARDVDRAVSFWADDAIVFPPGGPAVAGKAAIREYVTKSFQTPGFTVSWKTAAVEASSGGDVAYTTGTNHVTFAMPDGRQAAVDGKAVAVWRRQKDGAWKCAIDIWNDASPPQ